jgi:hypothetical protein
MADISVEVGRGSFWHTHLSAHSLLKQEEFLVGNGTKEGFQQDDGLAEAGVQIVVGDIHGSPVGKWIYRVAAGQLIGRPLELAAEIHDHLM